MVEGTTSHRRGGYGRASRLKPKISYNELIMNNSTGATAGRDFDPYAPYRGRLLPNERVRELSRLRPARAIIDALGCWLVIGAAWAAVALGSPWWTLLAVPVIGTRFYALFIIGHDGLHRRVFNESRWNDLFCDLVIFAPIGAITRINNRNHLMHHWHLSTSRDPDRHRHACFNKYSRSGFVAFLTGTSTARTSARNVFLNRDEDGIGETEGGRRYQLRDAVALLSWQAVLIGGLSWGIGWWAYPVLWILPIGLFTALGDNVRAFTEHSHPEADAAADAHRLITYRAGTIECLFFAPFNMNYHAAHHLWPSIPYYNLPQADEEMMRHPDAGSIDERSSYLGYLFRYWRSLPLEPCRPNRA